MFHEYVKGLVPAGNAVAVPLQILLHAGLIVVNVGVGFGFIVTVAVAVAVHPPEFVTVTV